MATQQVYGSIRRVLSNGKDGAPWIAEIRPLLSAGTLFLELDRAPTADVGDDIMTTAEVTMERNGQIVARNPRIEPRLATALKRMIVGGRGTRIDASWMALSHIMLAEKHSDVRTVIDEQTISIIRPSVTSQPVIETNKPHHNQKMVGHNLPRFVLDPVAYRNHRAYTAHQTAALSAGTQDEKIAVNSTEITLRAEDTRATLMNFGNVESCSYTLLAQLSGPGMVPKFDIPAALAHEFKTVNEFALSMDDLPWGVASSAKDQRRRMASFADAFAITELALAGRSLRDLGKIVACREAAIIGASFRGDGKRIPVALIAHLSGDAARAALNEVTKIVKKGGVVKPDEVVRHSLRISRRHTISDSGIKELDKALQQLKPDMTSTEIAQWLGSLSKEAKDKALAHTAARLAKISQYFFIPSDRGRKDTVTTVATLHKESLKKHVEYSAHNGLLGATTAQLVNSERDSWGVKEPNFLLRGMRAFLPKATSVENAVLENIEQQVTSKELDIPEASTTLKIPDTQSGSQNPWAYSVADRIKQSAAWAEQAYAVITEIATIGTVSPVHQDRFNTAIRSLSSFAEAISWRDRSKDSKSVQKRFEGNPELEDHFRMAFNYIHEDIKLPVSEEKRLQLQAIILAINPKAELTEMPIPSQPSIGFGTDLFMGTDRD